MPYPIYMTGQNLNSLVLACGHNANSLGWRDLLLLQNFNWLSPHLKKMVSLYMAGLQRFPSFYQEGMIDLNIESFGTVNNKNPFVPNFYQKVHSLHCLLFREFALLPRIQLGNNLLSVQQDMQLGVFFLNPREKAGIVTLLGGVIILHSPNPCQSESAAQVEFRIP